MCEGLELRGRIMRRRPSVSCDDDHHHDQLIKLNMGSQPLVREERGPHKKLEI